MADATVQELGFVTGTVITVSTAPLLPLHGSGLM